MRKALTAFGFFVLLVCSVNAAQSVSAKGRVESVTLYRGQALVTRLVPVDAKEGAVQLTVTDLPEAVEGSSLFASGGSGIQVRAVRYRTQVLDKAPEGEAAALDDKIADVEKRLRENTQRQEAAAQNLAYLDRLGSSFVAPTVQTEMAKGVLNAETLGKVTEMMFGHRNAIAKETLKVSEDIRDFQKQLDLLKRKRDELAASHSKALREALVFLDKAGNDPSAIRLNYIVQRASWSPIYNVRGTPGDKDIRIEFGALVQQTSGEDWDTVALTLSTAVAALAADGPALAPLRLTLTSTPQAYAGVGGLEQQLSSVKGRQVFNISSLQSKVKVEDQDSYQWQINDTANTAQRLEMSAKPEDIGIVRKVLGRSGSSLAVNYPIGGEVSLASRHDNQLVEISKMSFPAVFFCEATPLLTEYVYRYAEAINESDISLLEGSANVYMGNEFVGTVNLPLVARGQKVTIGFGINPQLRAWREFISKEESGQMFGSNKEVVYKYRLVLENYGATDEGVRVLDRIPVRTDQISVKIGTLKDALSTDAEYQRVRLAQGILRWDIPVPAHSARGTARLIEYNFTLEFDAKLHISTVEPAPAQMKADFDKVLEERRQMH